MNPTNIVTKIDTEKRNSQGFPDVPAEAKNVCQISNNQQPVEAHVKQLYGINLQLPWFVLLALVSGAALALVIEDKMGRPQELEWAMRTAKAEMRAETAQAVARAQEQATAAAVVSDTWRNRVNKLEAEANARRR